MAPAPEPSHMATASGLSHMAPAPSPSHIAPSPAPGPLAWLLLQLLVLLPWLLLQLLYILTLLLLLDLLLLQAARHSHYWSWTLHCFRFPPPFPTMAYLPYLGIPCPNIPISNLSGEIKITFSWRIFYKVVFTYNVFTDTLQNGIGRNVVVNVDLCKR